MMHKASRGLTVRVDSRALVLCYGERNITPPF